MTTQQARPCFIYMESNFHILTFANSHILKFPYLCTLFQTPRYGISIQRETLLKRLVQSV
jgi:hypothetical protein